MFGCALTTIHPRGPDAQAAWFGDGIALGHARLSIIDPSSAGNQPLTSADGRYSIVFNGEAYNYLELRSLLHDYPFKSQTDTEVVIAAWARWGAACLDKLIGMFAFVIWDHVERELVAVRDRFGVKPLYYANTADGIALASEIKALHALGVPRTPDEVTWAGYLAEGTHDHSERTFWSGVSSVPAGSLLRWRAGSLSTVRWYDLAERVGEDYDTRPATFVCDEYRALLEETVKLRFRADVPVGINLSGGLDSSILLGLVHRVKGGDSNASVFTFATGDPAYDELPWVNAMLATTRHPLVTCVLHPRDVPERAASIARAADEPYGGLPTLAYSVIFEEARKAGVLVLLDGQGMDEQWAGYDYYASSGIAPTVQGSSDPAVRRECLAPEFAELARGPAKMDRFPDRLRNLQLRDTLQTKLPRALRYNDRISMAASTELREPFLDHRLFELAIRQPPERKLREGRGKVLLREITADLIPPEVQHVGKRPVQTPQREWLRGPLKTWANDLIEATFRTHRTWFDVAAARDAWNAFARGQGDNSNWVWQWLSMSL